MRTLTGLIVATALAVLPAAGASALTLTNDADEDVKVVVERWMTIIRPGKDARFQPFDDPTKVRLEFRHFRYVCEAGPEDEIQITKEACFINGERASSAPQMQL